MTGGCIDIFQTRRELHDKAWWWKVNSKDKDLSRITYETEASGSFLCKQVGIKKNQNQYVGEYFQFSEDLIQLETRDDVKDLSKNDLVKFQDQIWKVVDIQKKIVNKQVQFAKARYASFDYIINLRGMNKNENK